MTISPARATPRASGRHARRVDLERAPRVSHGRRSPTCARPGCSWSRPDSFRSTRTPRRLRPRPSRRSAPLLSRGRRRPRSRDEDCPPDARAPVRRRPCRRGPTPRGLAGRGRSPARACRDPKRVGHETPCGRGSVRELALNLRVDLVENARHADEHRGVHLRATRLQSLESAEIATDPPTERRPMCSSTVWPKACAHGEDRERAIVVGVRQDC